MKDAKRILFIYPHDFLRRDSGINVRFCEWAEYFLSRDYGIDLFTLKNFESIWSESDIKRYDGVVDNIYFYDFKEGWVSYRSTLRYKFEALVKWAKGFAYDSLPDFAFEGMQKMFNDILKHNQYEILFFSYAYWAGLLDVEVPDTTTTVLEISDFLAQNLADANSGNVNKGKMIKEEIRRVNRFDRVICISDQERSFFSSYAKFPKYTFVPFFMDKKDLPLNESNYEFDILFLGSDNPHNQVGIKWFFDLVYPLLKPECKILIVGKITAYVPEVTNVKCVLYMDNVDDAYRKSRIAICPLHGGTGMKIKVIESIAYNRPIVTTSFGITGIPSSLHSGFLVADEPSDFAGAINLLLDDFEVYREKLEISRKVFENNFEKKGVYLRLDRVFG